MPPRNTSEGLGTVVLIMKQVVLISPCDEKIHLAFVRWCDGDTSSWRCGFLERRRNIGPRYAISRTKYPALRSCGSRIHDTLRRDRQIVMKPEARSTQCSCPRLAAIGTSHDACCCGSEHHIRIGYRWMYGQCNHSRKTGRRLNGCCRSTG